MNIYNLRYFVTLARIRQYTKAAEELCITQPSLSHAISQMEKELGVKLFEKNGHKITLTQFGEEFLSYAEKTLDVLDDGIASIKRSAMGNGTIRLGLVRPLGISYVPRMAAAFIKKNPKLDIDFTFHTDVTGRLLDDMQLGKYDLLFCSKPSEEYHFTAEPVMKQRLVLITPKGHPLAKKRKRSINLAETAGYSYVCFDKNSGIRSIFDEMLKRSDITVKVAYETEEDQVIAGLVASGFGIAVVPYMDILEKMSVEIFEIESPEYERSFYMVNDNSTYMSPAVETFRNFVIENTSIRIDLAQYREMEVFTQFASDLDDATKAQLQHGKALMELLKQPLCHPLSMHEQVMTLVMANNGVFDEIPTKEVKKHQTELLEFIDLKHPEIGKQIEDKKEINDELVKNILEAVKEFA